MKSALPAVNPTRHTGKTQFRNNGTKLPFRLADFWAWSYSSLLNNVIRGNLAEFIVAKALDIQIGVRTVWAAYDLLMKRPHRKSVKVQVKSASLLQEWEQDTLTNVQFNVQKTRRMNPKTGLYTGKLKRHADVYVLALLKHKNKHTVQPLDLAQWEFYVLPVSSLNKRKRSQHSINLNSLAKENKTLKVQTVDFSGLRSAVIRAAE